MHLREVVERNLTSHAPARGPPAEQVAFAAVPVLTHREDRVLARPLRAEQSGKHRRIPRAGPAAALVQSDVPRPAARQQPLFPAPQTHAPIIHARRTAAPLAASLYLGVDLPLRITHWHFMALYLLFMNLSISLPASVVAWTEPDPEPDELLWIPADRPKRLLSV